MNLVNLSKFRKVVGKYSGNKVPNCSELVRWIRTTIKVGGGPIQFYVIPYSIKHNRPKEVAVDPKCMGRILTAVRLYNLAEQKDWPTELTEYEWWSNVMDVENPRPYKHHKKQRLVKVELAVDVKPSETDLPVYQNLIGGRSSCAFCGREPITIKYLREGKLRLCSDHKGKVEFPSEPVTIDIQEPKIDITDTANKQFKRHMAEKIATPNMKNFPFVEVVPVELTRDRVREMLTPNSEHLVSGKAIHALDEKRKSTRFNDWRVLMERYFSVVPVTKNKVVGKPGKENYPPIVMIDYLYDIDSAKKLSMALTGNVGDWAREYFLECERIAKGLPSFEETKKRLVALVEPIQEKVDENEVRHDLAVLTADQRAMFRPLFSYMNQKYQASCVEGFMKRAAKKKFLPDIPSNDCTWHDIRQRDVWALADFFGSYMLNDIDKASLKKFLASETGQGDHTSWVKRTGFDRYEVNDKCQAD